mmetsp:Transcript_14876/g.36981  ORF Transcript_14876/g.36981 Transcript_14876/m.36981 type:complete len:334 (+) Transcript_14876:96-1097(+)
MRLSLHGRGPADRHALSVPVAPVDALGVVAVAAVAVAPHDRGPLECYLLSAHHRRRLATRRSTRARSGRGGLCVTKRVPLLQPLQLVAHGERDAALEVAAQRQVAAQRRCELLGLDRRAAGPRVPQHAVLQQHAVARHLELQRRQPLRRHAHARLRHPPDRPRDLLDERRRQALLLARHPGKGVDVLGRLARVPEHLVLVRALLRRRHLRAVDVERHRHQRLAARQKRLPSVTELAPQEVVVRGGRQLRRRHHHGRWRGHDRAGHQGYAHTDTRREHRACHWCHDAGRPVQPLLLDGDRGRRRTNEGSAPLGGHRRHRLGVRWARTQPRRPAP